MKYSKFLSIPFSIGIACLSGVHAAVIDDFSGDLSNYTSTVILDVNGGGSNTASWQIVGGALQYQTSAYDGIEQSVLIFNGLNLQIGEEVQVDVAESGNQDIGLYVGGTIPVAGVRQNYINIYARTPTELYTRGFLGTGEISINGGPGQPEFSKLFILRDGENDFELGYYDGATRVVISDRNNMTGNDASVVGFYTDVRGTGTVGTLDNLSIVPEPSVSLLGALAGFALLRRRRA